VIISGGSNGQVLTTNGSNVLSWTTVSGGGNGTPGGSNTQVQFNDGNAFGASANFAFDKTTNNLTLGGNVIAQGGVYSNIISSIGNANIEIWVNHPTGFPYIFTIGGALTIPGGHLLESNAEGEFELKSDSGIVISSDTSNTNQHFTFGTDGVFTAPSNVNLLGTRLNIGSDSITANLVNPTLIISTEGSDYIQAAIINSAGNGSSDWAAYGEGADDFQAFADIGFAGHSFNDANFSITNPGDAYIFGQGYANGIGGSLVLVTGENGNVKDIVFATGGFTAGTEFARIDHANDVFHLTRANSAIKFSDGTVQTTAYTGGGGDTGNVTFDDTTVQGDDSTLNLSAGPDYTANLAYLQIRAGDVASHIHFDTGNNEAYDLIVGNDQKFVQVSSTGNIIMSSYDSSNAVSYAMTLDNTGNLILPGNTVAINFANGSEAFGNLVQWTTAPIANTSAGSAGEAAYDSGGNLYVCVLTNTWAKFSGTTSW
jgi:hypothetical protein